MQHEMKLPEKLPELQKSIIDNMSKNSRITYVQLADITGKSRESIRKNIKKLKEAGLIQRIGPDKGGFWQILIGSSNAHYPYKMSLSISRIIAGVKRQPEKSDIRSLL